MTSDAWKSALEKKNVSFISSMEKKCRTMIGKHEVEIILCPLELHHSITNINFIAQFQCLRIITGIFKNIHCAIFKFKFTF